MKAKNTAIVVTGEGARGAFQSGVIKSIYPETNPAAIYGISSGAVNAIALSYISANELFDIWYKIKSISDVFSFNTFSFWYKNGLYNSKKIEKIASQFMTLENTKNKPYSVIARVDAYTGKIQYLYNKFGYEPKQVLNFLRDAVTISGLVEPRLDRYVDAGAVELNPLSKAIEDGFTDLHLVMGSRIEAPDFKPRTGLFPAVDYAIRSMMITMHMSIIDDIAKAVDTEGVKLTIYTPKEELAGQLDFAACPQMCDLGTYNYDIARW